MSNQDQRKSEEGAGFGETISDDGFKALFEMIFGGASNKGTGQVDIGLCACGYNKAGVHGYLSSQTGSKFPPSYFVSRAGAREVISQLTAAGVLLLRDDERLSQQVDHLPLPEESEAHATPEHKTEGGYLPKVLKAAVENVQFAIDFLYDGDYEHPDEFVADSGFFVTRL